MVQLAALFLSLVAISSSVHAAPLALEKRIAQVIADSTAKWEQACLAAGGATKCNPLSIAAFSTLLAAAGDCDQQDAADGLMNLSKQLNSQEMISLAQIFVQQPRNSPNSVATPYCQKAPQNAELNGLFQCQFQGSNQNTFANGSKLGGAGTIPFGLSAPLNPLGSCPANTAGPIADGTQLVDLTTNPGKVGGGAAQAQTASPATVAAAPKATANTVPAATGTAKTAIVAAAGSFQLQNGKDAQALNKKFATLSATSSCTAGETACVNGGFAQCVGGKFAVTSCGALTCFALPLVNSPGTSVTCDTQADALARIAASGATGGLTGA
ncbi:hypothetical protein D9619_006672 [Psilocybe cf. subviscida]|uniref:Carbohydrate-binding module family 19 domain-containing protein n=1 Tax=Psilocybe cf. subviscida TaxID=2480587 RepID=A0A8H5B511_9AGAR|nr:hypothetical protein D9619_006672 [Psilocybe cf. subviscida]